MRVVILIPGLAAYTLGLILGKEYRHENAQVVTIAKDRLKGDQPPWGGGIRSRRSFHNNQAGKERSRWL